MQGATVCRRKINDIIKIYIRFLQANLNYVNSTSLHGDWGISIDNVQISV